MLEKFRPDEILLILSFLSFFLFIICRIFAKVFETDSIFLNKLSAMWLLLSLIGFAGFAVWGQL